MSLKKETRPRGRPRTFDKTAALDKATEAFWTYGYEDASLDQIMEATGLARASIYSAFGDKEMLYLAVLQRFIEKMSHAIKRIDEADMGLENMINCYFLQRWTFISVVISGAAVW